jgi:hypothetical protein
MYRNYSEIQRQYDINNLYRSIIVLSANFMSLYEPCSRPMHIKNGIKEIRYTSKI